MRVWERERETCALRASLSLYCGKQAREGIYGADFKPTGATLVTAVETPEIRGQGNMEEDMDEGQTQKGNGMLFSPLFSHPSF